jgi:hypothetical protein
VKPILKKLRDKHLGMKTKNGCAIAFRQPPAKAAKKKSNKLLTPIRNYCLMVWLEKTKPI